MKFFFILLLLTGTAFAQNFNSTQTLNHMAPSIKEACTVDSDADTGEHNRLTMTERRRYVVYCTDSTGLVGVACECLQGTSTVDASSSTGVVIFAGQPVLLLQKTDDTHISCVPATDNSQIHLCPVQ